MKLKNSELKMDQLLEEREDMVNNFNHTVREMSKNNYDKCDKENLYQNEIFCLNQKLIKAKTILRSKNLNCPSLNSSFENQNDNYEKEKTFESLNKSKAFSKPIFSENKAKNRYLPKSTNSNLQQKFSFK